MNSLKIKHTGVFTKNYKYFKDPKVRFLINQGGSRSSKTYSICQLLIWYAITHERKIVSVVRKTGPALFASVYKDLIDIMHELNIYDNVKHNKSGGSFEFPNGSIIKFFSVDNPQKLRGRKHDLVFLNEANELTFEDFTQINMRTTGKIILDWNPSDEFSWVVELANNKKAVMLHSTYLDNPFLGDDIVREIENLINVDETYYQIYALGHIPRGREKVFTNIHMTEFPADIDYVYGIDFGYVDPCALVQVGLKDGKLYIKELMYESYLTTEQMIGQMETLGISKSHFMYADSARPDQIESLRQAGYAVSKANKKIAEGLDFMRTKEIHIDPVSTNAYKEFRSYSYKKIKETFVDVPVDFMNHSIDAARYAAISFKSQGLPSFTVF